MRTKIAMVALAATALILTGCSGPSGSEPTNSEAPKSAYFDRLPSAMQKTGVLQVAYQQHPPYLVVDGAKLSGPNYDLAEAIAKHLGLKAEHTEVGSGLAPVLAGLKSGRYDIFMGPIQITTERVAEFDLIGWVTSLTNYLVDKNVVKGNDATALCGHPVAFVDASQIAEQVGALSTWCVNQGKRPISSMPLADTNATLLAVKSGRAIAAGTTAGAAQYTIDADKTFSRIPQPKDAEGLRNNEGLVLPKDNKITPLVLDVLKKMFSDGSYAAIMKNHNLSDLAPDAPALNPPHQVQ